MNISEVKDELGYKKLELFISKDSEGKETGWLSHWDIEGKTVISIHTDTADEIEADPSISNLGIQTDYNYECKAGKMSSHRIIRYTTEADRVW